MKKRAIGVLTLLIIILGSCATLAVATPITTLGTINYYNTQDNFCINGDIPGNANLTYIYSEMNESGLKLDKIWYDSFTNKTTYKFTTQKIFVQWWFTPGIKEFVYIDVNTNNLYQVNVNYSEITIPENPYIKQHRELRENYTLILNNYNLTNETLANITLHFNELNEIYNLTMLQFNMTLAEKQNLSENLTNRTTALKEINEDYNNTYALWESAVGNVTTLQTAYEGKADDYDDLEKDHNDLAGAVPWYIILSILGTFLSVCIYMYWTKRGEVRPEATDEIATGYGKIHSAIDKHILSRFRGGPKTGNEGAIEELTEKKEEPSKEETKDESVKKNQDDITILHKKIDENTRTMTKQFTGMFTDLNKKIDKVISEQV